MADEIKHEEARWTNPTNWGQGTAGAGVLALGAIEAAKGFGEVVKSHFQAAAASQAAATAASIELSKKDSEIAILKANAETDRKLTEVFVAAREQDAKIVADNKERDKETADIKTRVAALEKDVEWGAKMTRAEIDKVATLAQTGIAGLQAQVMGLGHRIDEITHTVIPLNKVCPEAMPRYNSWTAPVTAPMTTERSTK